MREDNELGVRQAGRRDIRRLAMLWAHAFPGERTVEQRVRQLEEGGVFGGIEQAWYLERDGRLAGAFRAYQLTQYLHGTPLSMLGLAAVAVAADARRGGIGVTLCTAAVRVGRERGDLVSALYPFRPSFYERLGWGTVGTLHAHRFAPAALPLRVARPRVQLAADDLLPHVFACYEDVARGSHGLIHRTPAIWRHHFAGQRHIFALPDGGNVRGYVSVSYGRAASAGRRVLHVHELIARDPAAYDELLSWVALQRDAWPLVSYDALPEERFDLLLEDPRLPHFRPRRGLWAPVAAVIRGPMLRVLDVAGALAARRAWPAVAPLRFTLNVQDTLLPENQGPWRVDFDGRRALAERGEGEDARLTAEPAAFAQIYAGELRVSEAVRLGKAQASGSHTRRTVRLLDEF